MRERLVRFSHPVRVFLLLDRVPLALARGDSNWNDSEDALGPFHTYGRTYDALGDVRSLAVGGGIALLAPASIYPGRSADVNLRANATAMAIGFLATAADGAAEVREVRRPLRVRRPPPASCLTSCRSAEAFPRGAPLVCATCRCSPPGHAGRCRRIREAQRRGVRRLSGSAVGPGALPGTIAKRARQAVSTPGGRVASAVASGRVNDGVRMSMASNPGPA